MSSLMFVSTFITGTTKWRNAFSVSLSSSSSTRFRALSPLFPHAPLAFVIQFRLVPIITALGMLAQTWTFLLELFRIAAV